MMERAVPMPPTTAVEPFAPDPADTAPQSPLRFLRLGVLIFLIASMIAGAVWLFGTEQGSQFRDQEKLAALGGSVREWVGAHQLVFLLAFVAAYIVCAVLLLPVWWLQIIAGFAHGLFGGLALAMTGSTAGAIATAVVSAWLGEEFVRSRIIGQGAAARRLNGIVQSLGRNGLLVVLICRLSYPVPYGVSNYLFGLTGIRLRDIAFGTAFGGIPVYAGWVAAGARPDWTGKWEFWAIVITVNLLVLIPLVASTIWRSRKQGAGTVRDPASP